MLVRIFILAFIALLALPSWAQPAPPDAIRLKSGALYRGTISELVPDGQVVMMTVTGETKTFAMTEVEYAGPAASLPGATPPAGAPLAAALPPDTKLQLRFHSDSPEITLHRRTSSAQTVGIGMGWGTRGGFGFSPFAARAETYEPLCKAPCDVKLEPGTYYLGLSSDDGDPIGERRPLVLTKPGSLVGVYEDNSNLRTAGWLTILGSFIGAGVATGVVAANIEPCNNCSVSSGAAVPLVVASGVALAGSIVGLILIFQQDEATVAVE